MNIQVIWTAATPIKTSLGLNPDSNNQAFYFSAQHERPLSKLVYSFRILFIPQKKLWNLCCPFDTIITLGGMEGNCCTMDEISSAHRLVVAHQSRIYSALEETTTGREKIVHSKRAFGQASDS
jgi:hypothetical protein